MMLRRYVSFTAGSILIVLGALAIYDEDVLTVEHVLTIMTFLGAIIAIFRFISFNNIIRIYMSLFLFFKMIYDLQRIYTR